MIAAGVAKHNESTGRVRDHFVNRLVLPIIHRRHSWENFTTIPFAGDDVILGFLGRRHPDLNDNDTKGPKYLNSPNTALFSLAAQLYIPGTNLYEPRTHARGARPVLVEGPMDAIAVTLATHGTRVGVAPLGTSLTEEQAHQLAALSEHARAGNSSDLDPARPVSTPGSSSPPTTTPTWQARSPPNATTGSSHPTTSTPATLSSQQVWIRLTCSPCVAPPRYEQRCTTPDPSPPPCSTNG